MTDTSRRPRIDLAHGVALAVLLSLWALCATLSFRSLNGPDVPSPLYVDPAPAAGHPQVAGFWDAHFGEDLRVGDKLLRFGDRELENLGRFETYVAFAAEARDSGGVVEVAYERAGSAGRAQVHARSQRGFLGWLPVSAFFVFAAVWLMVRTRASQQSRAFFLAFMAAGFQFAIFFWGSDLQTYTMIAARSVSLGLTLPLGIRAFQKFPDAPKSRGWFDRLWPWGFALAGVFHAGRFGLMSHQIAVPAVLTLTAGFLVATAALLTLGYRRADAIGRRRVRWVLLGMYAAVLPPLFVNLLTFADPAFVTLYTFSLISVGFVPLAVLISVYNFNLFDVDRLLSGTAAWNLLLFGAGALGIWLIPELAAAGDLMGIRAPLTQSVLGGLLALTVLGTQHRLRSGIERLLFAERFRVDHGAEQLQRELALCTGPRELIQKLGDGLDALMKPQTCAIYARDGDAFTPICSTGRVHPGFDASGPLAFTLHRLNRPLALGSSRRSEEPELDLFDRAVLDSLDAAMVVPIFTQKELRTVVCLGRRKSGDVYTPADSDLLSMLCAYTSATLERFEQSTLIDEMRAMQEELRGYVPRAVATRLAEGQDLGSGEQEATILFADILGYSSLAEAQTPRETFAMLGAYAEMATEVVRRYDGHLVDFAGDGIMAAFGLQTPEQDREVAAVLAALEIVRRASKIPIASDAPEKGCLSVCVGIASGPAFVGEIRSADHRIWAVIGTTTNRAARLQQLTRSLDAKIAIDEPTHASAGDAGGAFQLRSGIELRGLSEHGDIWMLPR